MHLGRQWIRLILSHLTWVKNMEHTNDQGLIQEIEEDIQRQRFAALWKRFGPALITAVSVIVIGTAAISGWNSYQLNRQQEASNALIQILDTTKKDEKIAALEGFVKTDDVVTQAVLARFFAAESAMDEGKKERAIAFYDALAQDSDVEPIFRGLADLLSVMAQFDAGEPKVLEARLEPLMQAGPWSPLASELVGHLALKVGDKERAKKIFAKLLSMKEVSPGVQRRANDLYQWLGGEA